MTFKGWPLVSWPEHYTPVDLRTLRFFSVIDRMLIIEVPFDVLNEAVDLFGTNHILLQNWVTAALSVSRRSQLW